MKYNKGDIITVLNKQYKIMNGNCDECDLFQKKGNPCDVFVNENIEHKLDGCYDLIGGDNNLKEVTEEVW